MGTTEGVRPAFYALRRGGWRDYITLLHPPYTLWHLSYVALGAGTRAALPPRPAAVGTRGVLAGDGHRRACPRRAERTTAAHRDPGSRAGRPRRALARGAVAIGIGAAYALGFGLLVFIAIGAVAVPAYNLELAFHNDSRLRAALGRVSRLTGYFVEAQTLRLEAFAAAGFATARRASLSERSRRRFARRGAEHATTEGIAPLERSLQLLVWALVALAVAVVAARLR